MHGIVFAEAGQRVKVLGSQAWQLEFGTASSTRCMYERAACRPLCGQTSELAQRMLHAGISDGPVATDSQGTRN